jgi:hypothetical protein
MVTTDGVRVALIGCVGYADALLAGVLTGLLPVGPGRRAARSAAESTPPVPPNTPACSAADGNPEAQSWCRCRLCRVPSGGSYRAADT